MKKENVRHTGKMILIGLVMLGFLLPISLLEEDAAAQEAHVGNTTEMREVLLRMSDDELIPIHPDRDSPARKTVPNGYEPRGYIKKIGSVEDKLVGEWKMRGLSNIITIGKPIKFSLWVSSTGPSSGYFSFQLRYGSAEVAYVDEEYVSGVNENGKRIEVVVNQANVTITEGGEDLTLTIWGAVNGNGMMIEYGDMQRDSGVSFMSNAIQFESIMASRDAVTVVFSEVFHAPLNSLYPVLIIDSVIMSDEVNMQIDRGRSDCGKARFTWPRKLIEEFLTVGRHTFEVGVAYNRLDINHSWSMQKAVEVMPPKEKTFLENFQFGDAMVLGILAVIIVIFFIYSISVISQRHKHHNKFVRASPVPRSYGIVAKKKRDRFLKQKQKSEKNPVSVKPAKSKPVVKGFKKFKKT